MHVYYIAFHRGELYRHNSYQPPIVELPQPNCHCCRLGCGSARGYEVSAEECSILLNSFAVVDLRGGGNENHEFNEQTITITV